jgi:hypothetical protein
MAGSGRTLGRQADRGTTATKDLPNAAKAQEEHASPSGRPDSSTERMYSAKQLTDALKSGLAAVQEQLQVAGPSESHL